MDFNVTYDHVISTFTGPTRIWAIIILAFICTVVTYYKFPNLVKKIKSRTILSSILPFYHKDSKQVNNMSGSNKNLEIKDKNSAVDLNQDNPIDGISEALGEVENVLVDLEKKARTLISYKDNLKDEKEKIEKNLIFENKLKYLANQLPPNAIKSGDYYESIKNYFDLCKLKDEKSSKLDNAYKQLQKDDKNIFPELQDYCEKWNESDSVDKLKIVIYRIYESAIKITTLQNESKDLNIKIKELEKNKEEYFKNIEKLADEKENLKKFHDLWEETTKYIEGFKDLEYEKEYNNLINQVTEVKEELPKNQGAGILLLDAIARSTRNHYRDLNQDKILDITNFSYCIKYLYDIINNSDFPDYSKMKEIAQNEQKHVTMELKNLGNKKYDEINRGIPEAIPDHFVDLCKKLHSYSEQLIKDEKYNESKVMIEALQMCIKCTEELYDDGDFRNMLKSFN